MAEPTTPSTCLTCGGDGHHGKELCLDCFGTGSMQVKGIHLTLKTVYRRVDDTLDRCNDILDKCNDIFEKLNE